MKGPATDLEREFANPYPTKDFVPGPCEKLSLTQQYKTSHLIFKCKKKKKRKKTTPLHQEDVGFMAPKCTRSWSTSLTILEMQLNSW